MFLMYKYMVFKRITIAFLCIVIFFIINTKSFSQQCSNKVGTIKNMSGFVGQSTRHSLSDTVFLCWGDRFSIDHNDDYALSDDPDSSTPPGVGYAWYKSKPTKSGNTLGEIKTDNVYSGDTDIMVTVDNLNGDAQFVNSYYDGLSFSEKYMGLGDPALVYYAPITVDKRVGRRGYYEDGDNSCVSANPSESFPVVYLNPIRIEDVQYNVGGDPLKVSFTIVGGLPEYYSNEYYIDVDVVNKYDNFDKAEILDESQFIHGGKVTIKVNEFGPHKVFIGDGISCYKSTYITVPESTSNTEMRLDTVSGQNSEYVIVECKVKNYPTDINTIGIARINYDNSIIQFDDIITPSSSPVSVKIDKNDQVPGNLSFDLQTTSQHEFTDFTIFRLRFKIIGTPGECSKVYFQGCELGYWPDDEPNAITIYPDTKPGLVCVELPPGLYADEKSCGSADEKSGTISFRVFNGIPPYSYTVKKGDKIIREGVVNNEGDVTQLFGLSNSIFKITITDSKNESFELDVNLQESLLSLKFEKISLVRERCYGYCDGEIEVKVADVFGAEHPNPYNIAWSNDFFGTDIQTDLCSGTYGITVTERDNPGCRIDTFVVLNTPKLKADIEVLGNASCEGMYNGRVKVDISGGTPENGGYTVIWNSDGPQLQEIGVTSSTYEQASGDVYLKIKDANKCKEEHTLSIGNKYEMVVESGKTDVTCNGYKNGTATFKANLEGFEHDTFDLFFIHYPFPDYESFNSDSFLVTGLEGGELIVTLKERGTGCAINDTLDIQEPDGIEFNVIQQGNYCCDNIDPFFLPGIQVDIIAGNFPITLVGLGDLRDTTTLSSKGAHSYQGLVGGDYSIVITDANMCEDTIHFTIEKAEGCLRIDTIKYDQLGCSTSTTTNIEVKAETNFGDITYTWIDGNSRDTINNTSNILSNAGVGTYIIEVKDNGCTIRDTIVLSVAAPYTVAIKADTAECAAGEEGGDLGYACVSVVGGNDGYGFLWEDGSMDDCRYLAAGNYLVTISDGNGCDVIDTVVVPGPSPMVLDYLDITDVSCNDGKTKDGKVTISVSGGDNPLLYNFSFNDSLNQSGTAVVTYDNLGAGENYLTVSYNTIKGHSCSLKDTIQIGIPPKLEIDYVNSSITQPSCNGECDGEVTLQAKGGNPDVYNYHWQELDFDGDKREDLCAKTYHIAIKDANNCEVIDSVVLEEPDELVVEIDSVVSRGINCFGAESGVVKVKHSGGNVGGEYTYKWSPDVSKTSLAENLPVGAYTITVTDEKGCSGFVTYEIKAQEPILFSPVQQDSIKCFGDKTCISVENVSGGSGPEYFFSIDNGVVMPVDSCIYVYGSKDPYLVTVVDRDGCREDKPILVSQPDEIIVDLGGDLVIELGEEGLVHLNTNTSISNVSWDIDTLLVDYEFLNIDKSELKISVSGNTTIYATIEDEDGCTATGELNVKVNTVRNVRVPNVFTPDGDGFNEEFNISVGKGVKKVNYIRVYDRFGAMMFEELNPTINTGSVGTWDGTYKGSNVNTGVYVYMVEVEFLDNRKILYRGSVTLLR